MKTIPAQTVLLVNLEWYALASLGVETGVNGLTTHGSPDFCKSQ